MAFIDEIKIHATAGKGGDGVVRWRQEKFIAKGGPAGGNGGKGGDIYAEATRDIHILSQYRHKKIFVGQGGAPGGSKSLQGKYGDDLYLKFPIGSIITHVETGKKFSLLEEGQKILLLKGGHGGYGNEHFKSSTNVTPLQQTDGKPGEKGTFKIELELFADIGLVGFPNAGKSSLLNIVTNADAKVGDYAFTTLDPNLGDFYGYIIADIPGLIEGASDGKGLGTKFLRHIKRTRMILHLVSFEHELKLAGGMVKAYKAIREELKTYGNGLDEKDELIVLTKSDLVDEKIKKKAEAAFKKLKKDTFSLSLYDDASVKTLRDNLIKMLKKK